MTGILCLEDGRIFRGKIFGDPKITIGEVCFNTSMSGYQEIITDPSYAGQIVIMTYPIIGNYGANEIDVESRSPFLSGFVVREYCDYPSNQRLTITLDSYLRENGITAIEGIDTRALVHHIRENGEMRAAIAPSPVDENELLNKIRNHPKLDGQDLASTVSTRSVYNFSNAEKVRIVVYDFGVKTNILRLIGKEAEVIVVPSTTDADEVLKLNPDGIVLSNGPGDPSAIDYGIKNIKRLIGKKPILGICLGHQLLSLALGAKTFRLKYGHHGGNHPVKELKTGRVAITVQNHCFAVDPEDIEKTGAKISHINLNDQTLEGFYHKDLRIFSYQFHPEAAPGPIEAQNLIEKFVKVCQKEKI
jgi:carbamoyl-phosphate synthase small subunit